MEYFYWTRLSEFTGAKLGKIFSDEVVSCCDKRQEVQRLSTVKNGGHWRLACVLQGVGHTTMPDLPTEDVSPRGTT